MNKRKPYIVLLILLLFIVALPGDVYSQCAMCKASAESSLKNDPSSMARRLNSGILYLMAAPYLMIMFIFRKQLASLFRKVFRRGARQSMAGQE